MLISAAVERHGLGPDLRGDILKFEALAAAFDLDVTAVLHQRQITGVDRDGQGPIGGNGRRVGQKTQQRTDQDKA